MKHCPTCNRTFSDDSLSFCLEDGIPLVSNFHSGHFFDPQAETLLNPTSAKIQKSVQAYGQLSDGQLSPISQHIESQNPVPTKIQEWSNQRLATKLYLPPARQTLVDRPHLLAKLEKALSGKLSIISAPAGFGKTSLVTAWREQSKMPLAWYSLDEDDNEPTRFADYLIGALQMIDEKLVRETIVLLQSPNPPPIKAVLFALLNELSDYGGEFVLAFDDYHLISEQSIHEGLSFFIERLPPQIHTLITTRSDPPFPLSRLRARGELKEIRATDLRFDEAEAAAFLNDVMKLELSEADILALEERTEGWITGLQLSALSLQGREKKSDFVKEFAGDDRFILDYLLEEVLHLQPEHVQNFLLRTSILNRFNDSLCNALTQTDNGYETLDYLNRSNLFLIPLDNKNNWFRYHHLFADLLRFKLRQRQENELRELQKRASFWCEENGLIEEAINYALATEDWERSLKLIEPIGYELLSLGKFERLKYWIEAIPETALKTHPMLCYWYVPPLLYKDELDKAEKYLRIIETAEPEELRLSLIAEVWTSRALVAIVCGDITQAEEFSKKAFELLPPDDDRQYAAAVHTKVLCTRLKGDMKIIEQTIIEALPIYQKAGHFLFETWARTYLGFSRAMQGNLHEGAKTLQSVIQFAKEHIPLRPEPQIYPYSALCDLNREWNDIETAKTYLDEALTLIQQTGRESYMILVPDSLKSLCLILEMSGNRKRSKELIENAFKRAKKYGNETVVRQITALTAGLNLRRGDLWAVKSWAESSSLTPAIIPSYQNELELITFARWLLITQKPDQALPLLVKLQNLANSGSRQRVVVETLILQSLAHQSLDNDEEAVETLEQVLMMTEPESFIRSYIDEGEPLSKLLLQTLKQKGRQWETEKPELLRYVMKLNDAFGVSVPNQRAQKNEVENENLPWWYLNDPLSEREFEVMQLVAQGLSNQEIGNKLFISAGTVKRHISNIYQKLDVHSRVQAIELARKFGLISITK